MVLTDREWPLKIATTRQNPMEEFFIPAFKESRAYDVAVGYFTSIWLKDAAEGFANFAEKSKCDTPLENVSPTFEIRTQSFL